MKHERLQKAYSSTSTQHTVVDETPSLHLLQSLKGPKKGQRSTLPSRATDNRSTQQHTAVSLCEVMAPGRSCHRLVSLQSKRPRTSSPQWQTVNVGRPGEDQEWWGFFALKKCWDGGVSVPLRNCALVDAGRSSLWVELRLWEGWPG